MHRLLSLVVAAGLLLGAASCGDDDGAGAADDATQETVSLTVGVVPVLEIAPLAIAQERGFFDDEGLRVEMQIAAGSAALLPAVVSGDLPISLSTPVSAMVAGSRDLPIKIVAPGADSGIEGEDISIIGVAEGSPVKRPQDLEGGSLAVPTLNSPATLGARSALEAAGVDAERVKFLEIPFPEMPGALADGKVDAAFLVEPFRTIALNQGAKALLPGFTALSADGGGVTSTFWVTSEQYLQENRDVVERFASALAKAAAVARDDPEAVRTAVQSYTEIPPEIVEQVRLPVYADSLNRESLRRQGEFLERYGELERVPDLDELIADTVKPSP